MNLVTRLQLSDLNPLLSVVNMENQALGEAYRQESTV